MNMCNDIVRNHSEVDSYLIPVYHDRKLTLVCIIWSYLNKHINKSFARL